MEHVGIVTDNQEEEDLETEVEELEPEDDDLKRYLSEMEHLEEDFSDLEDLDPEELQEMQDAINQVKESDAKKGEETSLEVQENQLVGVEVEPVTEEEGPITEVEGPVLEDVEPVTDVEEPMIAGKEATMLDDFSDIGKMSLEELREMKLAIEEVSKGGAETENANLDDVEAVSGDLETKIMQELMAKKEKKEDAVMTYDKFLEYVQDKRDKIWYHALWYLAFESEDHVASKTLLYDVLKEATSKSPIDPIPEHQFYFGLGYILRLTMNEKQVIRYMSGGKFKININVKNLKKLLEDAGEPINTKPKIPEEEKQKMFSDFLDEDFSDI